MMLFKAFSKKLFGAGYEGLRKNILVCIVIYFSLHFAEFDIAIAPVIKYLMTAAVTAGVMRYALSAENTEEMQNMLMLPFKRTGFVFSYISALGAYTVVTKTLLLIAVMLAVSECTVYELVCCVICMLCGIFFTAFVYSLKKHIFMGLLLTAAAVSAIFIFGKSSFFILIAAAVLMLSVIGLGFADPYLFCEKSRSAAAFGKSGRHSVFAYLFRYMTSSKNYIVNTVAMWGIACVLPLLFKEMGNNDMIFMGFGIITVNTPVCILLSSDPSLARACELMPSQNKMLYIPYCMFIFLCNMISTVFYLAGWQLIIGGITQSTVIIAVISALFSAVMSVLLERFFPVKNYKTKTDLWHHPRKYIVPAVILLIGGILFLK